MLKEKSVKFNHIIENDCFRRLVNAIFNDDVYNYLSNSLRVLPDTEVYKLKHIGEGYNQWNFKSNDYVFSKRLKNLEIGPFKSGYMRFGLKYAENPDTDRNVMIVTFRLIEGSNPSLWLMTEEWFEQEENNNTEEKGEKL